MGFFGYKKGCCRFRFTSILGIMVAVIGAIIVVQILPLRIWLFILGILLIALGCTLVKLF
ncbi:hypothetical protein JYG23_03930 [Sedimentibacter sp. zth1]|uniref:hypothetical protein n=1 Tax=Sedimentibacter sp. zth1 TaxID=2816908 RepID=UPI001A9107F9|nr:hypothetical protein [Sedimentibacter sp. zth1]QSX06615.1 hypothetical protein JYG23_03930 [Sedimentibacter sp. zth1]